MTKLVTVADLGPIEAAAKALPEAPWSINDGNDVGDIYVGNAYHHHFAIVTAAPGSNDKPRELASDLIQARNSLPALCATVRAQAEFIAAFDEWRAVELTGEADSNQTYHAMVEARQRLEEAMGAGRPVVKEPR